MSNNNIITIVVQGGVVQGISRSGPDTHLDNLHIEVRDYDISDYITEEELEEMYLDEDGNRYTLINCW